MVHISAEVLTQEYEIYRAWVQTPLGALELLRGGLVQQQPFRLFLDSETARRDLLAAVERALPVVAGDPAMADHLVISEEQYRAERRRAEAATAALNDVLSLNVDLRAALARAEIDHLEGCHRDLQLHHGTVERRLTAAQQELAGVRFAIDVERRDLNASLAELAGVRVQAHQAQLELVTCQAAAEQQLGDGGDDGEERAPEAQQPRAGMVLRSIPVADARLILTAVLPGQINEHVQARAALLLGALGE